jgi:L-cysteine S-thiosulfotransferase
MTPSFSFLFKPAATLVVGALAVAGCASMSPAAKLDVEALQMTQAAFRDQGIAKADRIQQDAGQSACSSDKPPSESVAKRIETEALASIKKPSDGKYLGDWREGEKLAQSGRGMTWSDASTDTALNGGNCYNCHQISKAEVSYGNIGPSLYNYGKLRGVADPGAAVSAPIVEYTWGKLWNSKAYTACSNMPRFGHAKLLSEKQLQDIMALLLDPKSPVNQ